jgi:hypothetical protein
MRKTATQITENPQQRALMRISDVVARGGKNLLSSRIKQPMQAT